MPLLTQEELNPLQAARRVAEEHIDTIRAMALGRLSQMPKTYRNDAEFTAENNRYHKLADVVGALQTIYDAVSELEFEEEQPDEPAELENDQDQETEEDEENDDEEDEEQEEGDED